MKKLFFTLMLFVLVAYGLNAQSNVLKIQMLDEEVTWTSDKLHNIYFDGDETLIVVESESLFTYSYAIEGIKKIYFDTDESFAEFDVKNASFVYPNPAKDNVRLIGVENQEVEIFSIDGKSFFKVNYDGRSLDVSNLPQGTYIIKTNCSSLKFNKI